MVLQPTTKQNILSWIAQLTAAAIMLQTLVYKFSGADESVYIFSKIGIEPWGRYLTGIAELIASTLLLVPAYCWAGACMASALMTGAIILHLTILGVSVKNDHGWLFILAMITLLSSLLVIYLHRRSIPYINKYFPPYV